MIYIINYCTGFYVSNGHGGCNMFIYNIISHNFRFLYNVLHLLCLHVFIIKFIHRFQQNGSQSHFLLKKKGLARDKAECSRKTRARRRVAGHRLQQS